MTSGKGWNRKPGAWAEPRALRPTEADLSLVQASCSPSSQLRPRKDLSCQRGFPEVSRRGRPDSCPEPLRTKISSPLSSAPDGVFEKAAVCAPRPFCSWEGGGELSALRAPGREPQCGKAGLSSRAGLGAARTHWARALPALCRAQAGGAGRLQRPHRSTGTPSPTAQGTQAPSSLSAVTVPGLGTPRKTRRKPRRGAHIWVASTFPRFQDTLTAPAL